MNCQQCHKPIDLPEAAAANKISFGSHDKITCVDCAREVREQAIAAVRDRMVQEPVFGARA